MSNNDNSFRESPVFYGLSLPSDAIRTNEMNLVFDDKKDLLEAMKAYKGSRFKTFVSEEEAFEFSRQVINREISNDINKEVVVNIEKSSSPFSGLSPQELTKLRKAIESDDMEMVEHLIWSNPRFLVSSGDTPVILQVGCRFNACHIASKANKPKALELILNTVSDKQFMKLLFPYDTIDVTQSRIDFLLDLYLNTPDKGFFDTPLHFGCKFGSPQVVSVLLRHPNCDLEKVNKLGKRPIDVICERKGDQSIKQEILKLFEAQIFIPVFRDNFRAQIGEPIKGSFENNKMTALAGPMSPKQADELFQSLKSPRKGTPRNMRIRLTDPRKGLERVARSLCKDMKINWTEFWPFLNTRIDLTSDDGLRQLEKHLRQVYYELDSEYSRHFNNTRDTLDSSLGVICGDFAKLDLNSSISSLSSVSLKDFKNEILSNGLKCQTNEVSLPNLSHSDEYHSDGNDSDDSFASALSSPSFLFQFYVYGTKISDEDIDAALAIQYVIESDRCLSHDFIQNWFQRVVREKPQHFESDFTSHSPLSSTPIKRNCDMKPLPIES